MPNVAQTMTAPATPLLSVTVLNYNYGHFLPKCLDSILSQSFENFELILINDKSTDNSLEVIEGYLKDPRIRLIDHETNKGFVQSLIEGAELSRGEFITVISADDWVLDTKAFEKQIAVLSRDPEVAFVYTNYGCYKDNETCTYVMHPAPADVVKDGLEALHDMIVTRATLHSGTVIRKSAYTRVGGYDPETLYAVDTKMWAGLCLAGRVAYLNDILYAYRVHAENMSRKTDVVKRTIREVLDLIDWSFSRMTPDQRTQWAWVRETAIRRALASYPLLFLFRFNNVKEAWRHFGTAFSLRPRQTLFQNLIVIMLVRTVLGERGYRGFVKLQSLFSARVRERLRSERLHLRAGAGA